MTRRHTVVRLSAGTIDAGIASFATFLVGLAAVNILDTSALGVYAVFFAAFVFGAILPHQLTYFPIEVRAVQEDVSERLGFLHVSARRAPGPSFAGLALAVGSAILVTYRETTVDVLVALSVTVGLTILLSPLQDHIRRMLHMAELSWRAVGVSIVQFVAVSVALVAGWVLDVPLAWLPFGALALANVISTIVGAIMCGMRSRPSPPNPPTGKDLLRTGRWFLIGAGAPQVANLATAAIISLLAGPSVLGFAEAARIVAQPIAVLTTGLVSVLGPPAMAAAAVGDAARAARPRWMFTVITLVASGAYFLVVGFEWVLNPMLIIVPLAYEVDWLVAATVAVAGVFAWQALSSNEMNAAHREKAIAGLAMVSLPFGIAFAATAGVTGAFALPLSHAARGVVRGVGLVALTRRVYRAP